MSHPETALFVDLPLSAQTNFSELFDRSQWHEVNRSISDLPGSFNKKIIKGAAYWYWQHRELDGSLKQSYLGPAGDRLDALVQTRSRGQSERASVVGGLAGLASACASLGCTSVASQHFKVINRLAERGFFRSGGVLVGTHAFIAMSNMLGVQWRSGWRTNDIDFAHAGKNISLALPANTKIDVHDAISSLEMGLLPAQSATTGGDADGATYLSAGGDLRIDFLTPAVRNNSVYRFEPLGVRLQPLKFMEFSLEETTQTSILSGEQALLVNIPSPTRYALHKLIVMAEREERFRTKIAKDASQVASILSYSIERSPNALLVSARDILGRGPGWRRRLDMGSKILSGFHPAICASLAKVLATAR